MCFTFFSRFETMKPPTFHHFCRGEFHPAPCAAVPCVLGASDLNQLTGLHLAWETMVFALKYRVSSD